jgi:uncharacterized repeat protein (TIGR03803 family)
MQKRTFYKTIFTALVFAVVLAAGSRPPFSVVHTFTGADGARPLGDLLLNGGILYGTTSGGGVYNAGSVFQIDVGTSTETVLHSFAGGTLDGADPLAGLIADVAGNLYGVTYGGGAHNSGTLFEVPFLGGFRLLHSFKGPLTEGMDPAGTLVMDGAGNIYGTTYLGGNTKGWGTTFEYTAGGIYFTGQSFSPNGALPRAGLHLEGGHLYGTTSGGGNMAFGGTVFVTQGTGPLYTFTGGADGAQPMAAVIGDGQGNLYGTASAGGNSPFGSGNGVIFKINIATHQETVLHTFTGPDGSSPMGRLVRDGSGNMYGTTMFGGAHGYGTVFELDSLGTLTTLYDFTGGADGGNPFAGLLIDGSGNLWGVTPAGGSAAAPGGDGVVFTVTLASGCGVCANHSAPPNRR